MPIITFSVPQDVYETIKNQAVLEESENLAAKRIILTALGVQIENPVSDLLDIQHRLEALEEKLSHLSNPIASDVEERLAAIDESLFKAFAKLNAPEWEWRLKAIEEKLSQPSQIAPDVEERLAAVENAIENIAQSFNAFRESNAAALSALRDMVIPPPPTVEEEDVSFLYQSSSGYTIEDTKAKLRELMEANRIAKEAGQPTQSKKEIAHALEIKNYPGPEQPWTWNGNNIQTALKQWGIKWVG